MKKGIMIVSLEMTASQILDKLVAKIGGVTLRVLSSKVKSHQDMAGIARAVSILDMADLTIRDDLHSITDIIGAARAVAKGPAGLGVLMVDYIQLVRADVGKNANREREVAEVSRSLRLLSLELGCLVIGITQLNKQGGARESQSIEQDATSVLVVKLIEGEEDKRIVSIPFQRNGPCFVQTSLRFNGRTASFCDDEQEHA